VSKVTSGNVLKRRLIRVKIALFSDIHGNLPALEAVLRDIETFKPDAVFCLGDLVDFAPWPNEVIAMLRQHQITTLMGNHDQRIAHDGQALPQAKHSPEEQAARVIAIEWTRQAISAESKSYLKSLPTSLCLSFPAQSEPLRILLTHATPRSIDEYMYEDHPETDLRRMLDEENVGVMIVGHTHMPYIRNIGNRLVLNVGSVGRGKGRSAMAMYATITVENGDLIPEIVHVPYPLNLTVDAIRDSGIPNFYADFLERSRFEFST
jgi:putative phosphoesterase